MKKVKYSDLLVLARIFTGTKNELYIEDSRDKVEYDQECSKVINEDVTNVLMIFADSPEEIDHFDLNKFDFVFDFSNRCLSQNENLQKFTFVQNLSGEIKYLFPSTNKTSNFLKFYQTRSLTSRAKKLALRIANMGGGAFLPHFSVRCNKTPFYEVAIPGEYRKNVSIYTGAHGLLRKAVVLFENTEKKSYYLKLPLSEITDFKIKEEKKRLNSLDHYSFNHFYTPNVFTDSLSELLITEGVTTTIPPKRRSDKVYNVISELSGTNLMYRKLGETNFQSDIRTNIFWLKNNRKQTSKTIVKNLSSLIYNMKDKTRVYCSLSHGDLTEWNMRDGKKIAIIDWEMCDKQRPLFYDLFHYELTLLLDKGEVSSSEFMNNIEQSLNHLQLQVISDKFGIDTKEYLKYYLVHKLLQEAIITELHGTISKPREAMMKALSELTQLFTEEVPVEDIRKYFLNDLEQFLFPLPYAALKFQYNSFGELPTSSDLDLLTQKKTINPILNFCQNHNGIQSVRVIKKSFMCVVKLFFVNGEFLSIDLITKFKRKSAIYLNANDILERSIAKGYLIVPSAYDELALLQRFYTLNHAEVPKRYKDWIKERIDDSDMALFNYFYQENISFTSQLLDNPKRQLNSLRNKIRNSMSLKSKVVETVFYFVDTLRSMLQQRGFIITFSGVDGAGKTTIIDRVKAELQSTYRKEVVMLRHRPGLLPILSSVKYGSREKAEQSAADKLPRQGGNKSTFSSILRFSYYYLDYQVGQVSVYFKYILRGKIVIYDRYYFDFINDSKRSNIELNRSVIKKLYALVHHPDFNFYLYNNPNVILKRKQELSEKDITLLHERYSNTFREFKKKSKGSVYEQVKNSDLNKTVEFIMSKLKTVA